MWFLASYSPDLNPIEEALIKEIARALAAVTSEDARGWFVHASYRLRDRPL